MLADAVASSIYHITCGKYFDGQQLIEPRCFYTLLPHFYKKDNSIFSAGLKFVHKIEDVELSDKALNFFPWLYYLFINYFLFNICNLIFIFH